jgi:hypothetical protein
MELNNFKIPMENTQSEWNEQQWFSTLFFNLTNRCRFSQSQMNILGWKSHLESKISLIMGILKEKEQKHLKSLKDSINIKSAELYSLPNNKIAAPLRAKKRGELATLLFNVEAEVDTMTNRHLPFLNLKKRIDIGNL